jgi:hypothetical protein
VAVRAAAEPVAGFRQLRRIKGCLRNVEQKYFEIVPGLRGLSELLHRRNCGCRGSQMLGDRTPSERQAKGLGAEAEQNNRWTQQDAPRGQNKYKITPINQGPEYQYAVPKDTLYGNTTDP